MARAALIKTRSWTKYFQNAPETAKFASRRAILTDPQFFFFTRDLGYSDFLDASLSRTTVFLKNTTCTDVDLHSSKFSTKTS